MNLATLAALGAQRSLTYAQDRAQAYAEAVMNARVSITRPASATYDEVTREYTKPTSSPVYTGPAGLTIAGGPITMAIGDEPTYYSSLTAYVPHQLEILPRIDDVITVLAAPDVDLVGRSFRITDVPVGGRVTTSMSLSAVGIAPSRQWS